MTRRTLFPILAAAAAPLVATPILNRKFSVDVFWYPRSMEKAYQFLIKGKLHEFVCTPEMELFFLNHHKVEVQDLVAEYIADAEGCLIKPEITFQLYWPPTFKMVIEQRKMVPTNGIVTITVEKHMSKGTPVPNMTLTTHYRVRYKLVMSAPVHTMIMYRNADEYWTDSQPVAHGGPFRRA